MVVVLSTASTCYLSPRNQSAPDAYLPLVIMWSWLSVVGAVGVVPNLLGSRARRALNILLATMICAALSVIFDYWIVGVVLGRDVMRLNQSTELVTNAFYVLLLLSSLAAPVALFLALLSLRSGRQVT